MEEDNSFAALLRCYSSKEIDRVFIDSSTALEFLTNSGSSNSSSNTGSRQNWQEWGLFPSKPDHYCFDTWVSSTRTCVQAHLRLNTISKTEKPPNSLPFYFGSSTGSKATADCSIHIVKDLEQVLRMVTYKFAKDGDENGVLTKVDGFVEFTNLGDLDIKRLVDVYPVIVCMDAKSIQGVVPGTSSRQCVVIAGYDPEGWILLNSYAGEHHYFKLGFNAANFAASFVLVPLV